MSSCAARCRLAGAAVLLLCACGAGQTPQTPRRARERCVDSAQLPDCSQRVQDFGHDLDTMLSMAAGGGAALPGEDPSEATPDAPDALDVSAPDCSAVRDLRDRICELDKSICGLITRPDATTDTQARCKAANTSCERARNGVARVCP